MSSAMTNASPAENKTGKVQAAMQVELTRHLLGARSSANSCLSRTGQKLAHRMILRASPDRLTFTATPVFR